MQYLGRIAECSRQSNLKIRECDGSQLSRCRDRLLRDRQQGELLLHWVSMEAGGCSFGNRMVANSRDAVIGYMLGPAITTDSMAIGLLRFDGSGIMSKAVAGSRSRSVNARVPNLTCCHPLHVRHQGQLFHWVSTEAGCSNLSLPAFSEGSRVFSVADLDLGAR